jgi:VCBS repeat-containing protein
MASFPSPGNDIIIGTAASEQISALAGNDNVRAGGGNDTVHGNGGHDNLFGEGGHDHLWGDAGNDSIVGGTGIDYAHYTGTQAQYQITTTGGVTKVKDLRSTGSNTPDGIDRAVNVERLAFGDGTFRLLVPDQPPDAVNDAASTNEDTAININALANDTDPDGDTLTFASLSDADPDLADIQTAKGATISVVDGQIRYDPMTSAQLQALDTGQDLTDSFSYTVSDGFGGTDTATVEVSVSGTGLARSFDGQTVDYSTLFPDINTAFYNQDITVGPGLELTPRLWPVEFGGHPDIEADLDIDGSRIIFDYTQPGFWIPAPFNGQRFFDEYGTLSDFSDVSIVSNNVPEFDQSDIRFDADNIWINWAGIVFFPDSYVELDVAFA